MRIKELVCTVALFTSLTACGQRGISELDALQTGDEQRLMAALSVHGEVARSEIQEMIEAFQSNFQNVREVSDSMRAELIGRKFEFTNLIGTISNENAIPAEELLLPNELISFFSDSTGKLGMRLIHPCNENVDKDNPAALYVCGISIYSNSE